MTRSVRDRWRWWGAWLLALACPLVSLCTAWHLAVEAHHDHPVAEASDHDHEAEHHDDAGEEGGHHTDDHLLPDSLRPDHGPLVAIDLAPADVLLKGWTPGAAPTPAFTPADDVPPATDPPLESLRPRAPPVG